MTKARDLASGGFGLVLIKPSSVVGGTDNGKGTVNFTSQSSVSLNNVFNSTYDIYKIIVNVTGATAAAYLSLRLRVSNSDNSNASYRLGNIRLRTQSGEALFAAPTNNSTSVDLVRMDNFSGTFDTSIDVGQPFLSQFTTFKGMGTASVVVGTNQGEAQYVNGFFVESTSFTGFTLFAGSGTFSGSISVYGYNK